VTGVRPPFSVFTIARYLRVEHVLPLAIRAGEMDAHRR
jgi:hypothetical protein